jgi:hypothetical protein
MLLRNIMHNLSFADAQLHVKFLMKAILSSANNTNRSMLRHHKDVGADSKTRYKVFRAVKIKGNNFVSKKRLLISGGFPRLEKAKRRTPSYPTGVAVRPIGGGIRKNIAPASPTGRRQTYFRRITNRPGKSSAAILKTVKRFTKIVNETVLDQGQNPTPTCAIWGWISRFCGR